MAYYAIYSRYGNDTYHADTGLRTGTLLRFETARERDKWVNDCDWQESHNRMTITRDDARYHFKNAFSKGDTFWNDPGSWEPVENDDRCGAVPDTAKQWVG
jgi:hypothetical protein